MFEHIPATKPRGALTLFVTNVAGSGREVVSHYGTSAKNGSWTCHKHGTRPCAHIGAARQHGALEILFADVEESDEADGDEINAAELHRRRGKQN